MDSLVNKQTDLTVCVLILFPKLFRFRSFLFIMFAFEKKTIFYAFCILILLDVVHSNSVTVRNVGSRVCTLKCASRDNTIGPYKVSPNGVVDWSFNDNVICTTQFWCDLVWNDDLYHWGVYKCGSSPKNPVWFIRDDGIYDGNNAKYVNFPK